MKSKSTYMTYLSSDDYLPGTLHLIRNLRKLKSKYPICVVLTNSISNHSVKLLKNEEVDLLRVNVNEISKQILRNNEKAKQSQWSNTFGKLKIFGLEEFDKIVFLDSDMLVKENIDNLFTKPHLSAVVAGKSYPGNSSWKTLNSGLMVINPVKGEDKRLFDLLNNCLSTNKSLGDQDIIHMAYPNWVNEKLELPEQYNAFSLYEAYYVSNVFKQNSAKVIHFTGEIKPWQMNFIQSKGYCLKITIKQLITAKSMTGVMVALKDFSSYRKTTKKIKRITNNK